MCKTEKILSKEMSTEQTNSSINNVNLEWKSKEEMSTEQKNSKINNVNIEGKSNEGIIYTVIAAIVSAIAGTTLLYIIYYKVELARRTKISFNKGKSTSEIFDQIMAEQYALTIPEFDDEEERRSCCLNVPPEDFTFKFPKTKLTIHQF